ncbi:MAG: DUF5703 domain-containing protein [Clostridia bacterium]
MKKMAFLMCLMVSLSLLPDLPAESKMKIESQEEVEKMVYDSYNVIWTSQSKSSEESMPVGGHDLGLNLWVENNEVYFYIGKSDAFDENNQLVKLGLVKLNLTPNPFENAVSFKQELKLKEGYVTITAIDAKDKETSIDVWVDVYNGVIHACVTSEEAVELKAEYLSWRYDDILYTTSTIPGNAIWDFKDYPGNTTKHKDNITYQGNDVFFYHRNDNTDLAMHKIIKQQGMEGKIDWDTWYDPVTNFTYGGKMNGEGMVAGEITSGTYSGCNYKLWSLVSEKAATSHHIKIATYSDQTDTLEELETVLDERMAASTSHEDSKEWWNEYWQRSHIFVNDGAIEADTGWQVARNYTLFRYMQGCNAFGKIPTKFNGGLFTWEYNGDPDYRNWGGATMTAQNQRLLFWPMLKSGDFDTMESELDFYNNGCGNNEQTVKAYWGHNGTAFNEYPTHYGLSAGYLYQWADRDDVEEGIVANSYVIYEYIHQLDFAHMMVDYYRYSGIDIGKYIHYIESALTFFQEHYQMRYKQYNPNSTDGYDENGKLVIYPSTAVETYKNVLNPNDTIAGINAVIEDLIFLYEEGYDDIDVERWKDLQGRIPEMTVEDSDYGKVYKPGQHPGDMAEGYYDRDTYFLKNCEAPQTYVVFPFELVGVVNGEKDIDIAQSTWYTLNNSQKDHISWHYTNIYAARVGLTDIAKDITVKKMKNASKRFPAFWGPGHDWTPDHNWGGTGSMGLQEMALQAKGDVIAPFVAWPKDWDVDYKLWATQRTVVEAAMENGVMTKLNITVDENSTRDNIELMYDNVAHCVITDSDGNAVTYDADGNDKITFSVQPGKTYCVEAIPEKSIDMSEYICEWGREIDSYEKAYDEKKPYSTANISTWSGWSKSTTSSNFKTDLETFPIDTKEGNYTNGIEFYKSSNVASDMTATVVSPGYGQNKKEMVIQFYYSRTMRTGVNHQVMKFIDNDSNTIATWDFDTRCKKADSTHKFGLPDQGDTCQIKFEDMGDNWSVIYYVNGNETYREEYESVNGFKKIESTAKADSSIWVNMSLGDFAVYSTPSENETKVSVDYIYNGKVIESQTRVYDHTKEEGALFDAVAVSKNGSGVLYAAEAQVIGESCVIELKAVENASKYTAGEKITIDGTEYEIKGSNKAVNGDFAYGFTGWYDRVGNELNQENFEIISVNEAEIEAEKGVRAKNGLGGQSAANSIGTKWKVEKGKKYYVEFFVNLEGSISSNNLQYNKLIDGSVSVYDFGNEIGQTSTNGWKKLCCVYTAESNELLFQSSWVAGKISYTDFSVHEVNLLGEFKKDSFEEGMKGWSSYYGTPEITENRAHSGKKSYSVQGDLEAISKKLPEKCNDIVCVWFYDSCDGSNQQCIARADSAKSTSEWRGMGVKTSTSTDKYVYRMGSDWYATEVTRETGWHEFLWDYSSCNGVNMYIDGKLVAQDETMTYCDTIAMGDFWGEGNTGDFSFDDVKIGKYPVELAFKEENEELKVNVKNVGFGYLNAKVFVGVFGKYNELKEVVSITAELNEDEEKDYPIELNVSENDIVKAFAWTDNEKKLIPIAKSCY